MMIEAKCCICGQVVKAPPPKNSFWYIFRCDCCGQKQFLEQLPGMEFFAAIPFIRGTTPAQSIDEYFSKAGFKNTSDYVSDDKLDKKDFAMIGAAIGKLVKEKNAQYGSMCDAIEQVLTVYYPDGIKPESYYTLGLVVRICDKLGRLTRGDGTGDEDAFADIAGYGIIGTAKKKNVQNR